MIDGITVVETGESRYDVVNPGVFTCGSAYAILKARYSHELAARRRQAADPPVPYLPFFQKLLWQSAHAIVNAGVHATQSSAGAFVSPRLSRHRMASL